MRRFMFVAALQFCLAFAASSSMGGVLTIEAKAGNDWDPDEISVSVGDEIEWKMGSGSPGRHGVRITNWTVIKDHVEVVQVTGQQSFNQMTGRNDSPTNAAEKVLLRLKVKSVPPGTAEIKYNCIVHGITMGGEVLVESRK